MSGNACPQCGREHPWCEVEWSAFEADDATGPDPDETDADGPPYRVSELLPDILDFLARGSRGPDWAGARRRPARSLRGLIPGPRTGC
ncbi:hypothetical protein ACFRCG_25165 [Embleya sp. NPDC056575]|uniref:hypothetical protein n=1 Tax=unclassified Embleya TaxID=2699296 RepID=UPI0036B07937